MKGNIFISYSHSDKEDVLLYCEILNSLKLNYFLDKNDINGGVYAKQIMANLRSCSLFLVFISKNSIESNHVLSEVSIAFERVNNNEEVVILPIYLEEIESLYTYDMCYYINSLDGIMDFTSNRLVTFENKIRKHYGFEPVNNEIKESKNTYFRYDYETERNRLDLQQKMILSVDLPIYKKITAGKKDLILLDIGCGLCNSINNRVNGVNQDGPIITKVVGLEYDEKTVIEAKKLHPDYGVYQADVEAPNFNKNLKQICLKEGIEKFDIINISLLLLHLENPFRLLLSLRPFLKPNGVIFIRDVDDGFTYGYPDNDRLVERLLSIVEKTETSGYRRSGRRVGLFLKQLGFKHIERANLGMSSRDMNFEERDAFYNMCIPWFLEDITIMTERHPDSREWVDNLAWATDAVDILRERFFDPNFVYNLGTVIYIASDTEIE